MLPYAYMHLINNVSLSFIMPWEAAITFRVSGWLQHECMDFINNNDIAVKISFIYLHIHVMSG